MTTNDIVFHQPGLPPNDADIKQALGPMHAAYIQLMSQFEGIAQEWKFYGTKHGWQLKASIKGKALFYLVPRKRSFTFACAVREKERDFLLQSKLPSAIKSELLPAKKCAEGYPLRIQVCQRSDITAALSVVATLTPLRT